MNSLKKAVLFTFVFIIISLLITSCGVNNNVDSTSVSNETNPTTPAANYVLTSLTLSSGSLSPAFLATTPAYSVSVSNSVSSITVTPTASGSAGSIVVNGTAVTSGSPSGSTSLSVGTNTINVVVTPTGGSSTTYTISITRQADASSPGSPDFVLSAVVLSSGSLNPAFDSSVASYTASVANLVSSITLTPTAVGSGGNITVNGSSVSSGNVSGSISLSVGTNTITVVVTKADSTSTTYTITLTRVGSYSLSGLAISSGTLSPVFESGTTSYAASIAYSVSSITVTPTANGSGGTITVNGSAVSSGDTSSAIAQSVGSNTITIVVTPSGGGTSTTYTVTLTRAAASYSLTALSLSSGTLSPSFSSGTTSYTASVANSASSITVTPTAAGDEGIVTVNGSSVSSGNASNSISLSVGANTITVVITPTGGSATTYTIIVTRAAAAQTINTNPPASTVRLVFIHHSSGGNWLKTSGDFYGALGTALNSNKYYVTETDYDWDAEANDNLGDTTDTTDWLSWFNDTKMPYVYSNSNHSYYSNTISDPGGQNEIIMFKSCYPMSEVGGSIADEKAIYNGLLTYFAAHTDKLFILIIPPAPITTSSYVLTKQLNDWLVDESNGWLKNYSHNNVAVFDYYCVLSETDSHHRVNGGAVQHSYSGSYDGTSPYHDGDDHPNSSGNQKAVTEFLPLLNYYYNSWKGL
ncbi:MAG: cadherin-like beta sandwich domain-containing protein [Candidatus Saganbacteria bacterium]|nr:cadherin-like beta sandwich domain-containing protein [Candidatus Saganbacteria bacterium]